eukprot:6208439-Pleurochrysis_carterae.AAC.3
MSCRDDDRNGCCWWSCTELSAIRSDRRAHIMLHSCLTPASQREASGLTVVCKQRSSHEGQVSQQGNQITGLEVSGG